ncbi:MAG: hypothetical protein ACW98Y_12600 [Candidatus Thorarchaeota archaeon]|jgi:hypothetical protein
MAEEEAESIAVRLEKALEKKHPYTLPLIIMIPGIILLFVIFLVSLDTILLNHPSFDPFALLGYPLDIDYKIISVAYIVLLLFGMFVVYLVCLIPVSLGLLIAGKGMKGLGLSQDIAKQGTKFGGIQMILRSLLPGLFGIGVGLAALNLLIANPIIPPKPWPLSFTVVLTLYFGITGMMTGMALFPATWFVDDAGLVIQGHLNSPYRVPPRVDGVGNWIRSFFAGITMFLYPITMIWTFVVDPFLSSSTPIVMDLFLGILIIIIGMPLAMMSIVIPFVVLTENLHPRVLPRIIKIAKRLGAKEITITEPIEIETTSKEEE